MLHHRTEDPKKRAMHIASRESNQVLLETNDIDKAQSCYDKTLKDVLAEFAEEKN